MSASADFNRWLRAIFRSARTRQETQALGGRLEAMREQWEQSQRRADTQLAAMQREAISDLSAMSERMDAAQREAREGLRALSDTDESARRELQESIEAALRASAEVLEARFAELDGRQRALRARLDRVSPEMPEAPATGGEWTAMAFAEKFRGSVADIRSRLSVYVADVAQAAARTQHAPAMDIGCGRGDWLALMKEAGIDAFGVDESSEAVDACVARGLDARLGDAIATLRRQPDASVAAVTAFHVIEHLPFAAAATLVGEAHRVIRPGGILVIETPNCENILVGAYTFWLDPTHIRPYPMQLLGFMVAHAGFDEPKLRRLHPNQELADSAALKALSPGMRNLLAGPQDSGIVAMRKEH